MTIFEVSCIRGSRTQPLIWVGCYVHYWVSCAINFVVDTHLPRFKALAYVLPHFDARGDSCGVHLSKVC